MSNREVAGLQALAKKHGGELSVNPDTGLPEAGFLDSILPTIAGAGLTYFSGGAISPLMAAGIVGGISALDSKDLSKGLMAGLGAYGGGSMVGGLAGMGLEAGAAATATAPAQEAAMQAAIDNGTYQNAVGAGASNFGELFKSAPMDALSAAGGGGGYKAAGILGAAAAPMLADEMVETTTEAPEQSRGMIRPYTYSRQQVPQDYQGQQGNMGSKERRYFNESYTAGDPYAAAGGGLVALASGGYTNQNIFQPTTPLPANNMYGASRDAYDYLMGVNPTSGGGQTRPYDPNYPINDIRIDDGKNLNPNTPKTGKGRYEFDPVTRQYKWVPDPITPVDVAAPVFENPMQSGGGGGGDSESREAQRLAREKYFDNMTDAEREAHAESLRTGVNFISNLMPGSFIPKIVDSVQGFFKEQQYKDVMAKEAEKNEADRLKAESDNLLSMIKDTNETLAPTTPIGDPAQQAAIRNAINNTVFAGMDRGSTPNEPKGSGAAPTDGGAPPSGTASGANAFPGGSGMPPSGVGPQQVGDVSSRSVSGASLDGGAPAPAPAPSNPGEGGRGGGIGGGGAGRDGGGGGGYSGAPSGGDGVGRSPPGSAHDGQGGYGGGGDARGGYLQHGQFDQHMAHGGIANLHQYNLGSYSDGGRLLKGPGDGVSDDIPATIGHGQPARLADGEFVIPARIVSEIGNGSTDAGARELYKMMDRIQAGRRKTVGKDQVAKNSKAVRHLPA